VKENIPDSGVKFTDRSSLEKPVFQNKPKFGLFCEGVKFLKETGGEHQLYIIVMTINYLTWIPIPYMVRVLHTFTGGFEMPTEKDLDKWFRNNYRNLGFVKIIRSKTPDYIAIDKNGNRVRVELESKSSNFVKHNHNPDEVDLVICWERTLELTVPCVTVRELISQSGYHFRVVKGNPPLLLMECKCGSIVWKKVDGSTVKCSKCGRIVKIGGRVVGEKDNHDICG